MKDLRYATQCSYIRQRAGLDPAPFFAISPSIPSPLPGGSILRTSPVSGSRVAAMAASPRRAPVMTREKQAAMTPAQAVQELRDGNARFVAGRPLARDIRAQVAIEEQFPFAAIVSCIDSRTSNELVFDQGPGDIFSSRIAGNVIDGSVLGGLEFACRIGGAKAIVVVGHSSCGAVKGAIDQLKIGHLTSVLQRIEPAIEQTMPAFANRTSSDARLVKAVTHANVRVAMRHICEDSSVLREMIERGELTVAGAVVDLATGRATFLAD